MLALGPQPKKGTNQLNAGERNRMSETGWERGGVGVGVGKTLGGDGLGEM